MPEPITFLDALIDALRAAGAYNRNDQAPPAAILWPDKERQWEPLLPRLRAQLPLLTLGDYSPAERCGPAIYLRCMLARTLPHDRLPDDQTPILYLPGVSRQDIRAVEDCPRLLQPLAELQYRGVLWTQRNGRDWTVAAFLHSHDGGLGIDVAGNGATRAALLRALHRLADEPVAYLRDQAPLRAAYFDALLNPDDVRSLLLWLNDPDGYPARVSPDEWHAFCSQCRQKYGFDPERDGAITAAGLLARLHGSWSLVWQRFCDGPRAYPHLPDLLRRARPSGQLAMFESRPVWPQDNDSAEAQLRQRLESLEHVSPADVRAALTQLDQQHAPRRDSVWAKLGAADLALALEHLSALAGHTSRSLTGPTVADVTAAYLQWGWQADASLMDALAAVHRAEDVHAIRSALLPLYRPWLDEAARAVQAAVAMGDTASTYPVAPLPEPAKGTCLLFSDALRLDAAWRLATALEGRHFSCDLTVRLAALPTVTPTAKPAISPVGDRLTGGSAPLTPLIANTQTTLAAPAFRALLAEAGYQVLDQDEPGDPTGRAWTELGAIDAYGHQHGPKLAHHIRDELRALEERIAALLDRGWTQVTVITDHGWLLLPGGLPACHLPEHLSVVRKGRCARLKEGAHTDQQTVPWHWDPDVRIAIAPGIHCYEAGREYEHGGLSPQECIVPVLVVTPAAGASVSVSTREATWTGLRCRVQLSGAPPGLTVDIRAKAGDPATSLLSAPRSPDTTGSASLLVEDDERIGDAAFIVLLQNGQLCAQTHTTIGG